MAVKVHRILEGPEVEKDSDGVEYYTVEVYVEEDGTYSTMAISNYSFTEAYNLTRDMREPTIDAVEIEVEFI